MKILEKELSGVSGNVKEDFSLARTLVVICLFLIFMGTSVYLMLTTY